MSTKNVIPNQIRNFAQSTQHRSIAKQASDILVYIDGANYLVNPYIGDAGSVVQFNNYINSWTSTYDVDAMVPSGSLTLAVPVEDTEYFMMPGGNYLLNTMSEIRVFAKGYYLSAKGNSVYRQIFKGFISSINYTPDGKLLNLQLNCFGALGLLERMQIDLNPGNMSSSPQAATPYTSTAHNLDPYQQIAWVFLYTSMIDGFSMDSVQQMAMQNGNPYFEAVKDGYVAKWLPLLYDLCRDVHIFGVHNTQDVIQTIADNLKKPDSAANPLDMEAIAIAHDLVGKTSEVAAITGKQDFYTQIRAYHPDMGFSSMQLLNAQRMSRLERLRYSVQLIGFEGYQDIDGGIVIKPPLYNLDVLNLENDGTVPNVPKDPAIDPSTDWITDSTNPFVVALDEILNESETEDEAGVRLTRLTAQGSYLPGIQFGGPKNLLPVAEDVDIPKLTQFGLRTEPPREVNWFQSGDHRAIYAYTASELARANRGFRSYTCTIPLRPEIKLGFPMYFPHKDVYGYIKAVTMSWNKGASATTSIVCDTLRRRPLFPTRQTVPTGPNLPKVGSRFLTDQPNLVLQWTQASAFDQANQEVGQISLQITNPGLAGKIATLPMPQQLIVKQQIQITQSRKASGLYYTPENDVPTHNWRVQPDTAEIFSVPRSLDTQYYEWIRSIRPYTDNKGYELVGPFPWGRWKSLKDSLTLFTIENSLYANSTFANIQPVSPETETVTNASAFLFAGDNTTIAFQSQDQLIETLVTERSIIDNIKVFELAYTSDPTHNPGPGAVLGASAPPQPSASTSQAEQDELASTMLSGEATSSSLFVEILKTVPTTIVDDLAE